MKIPRTVMVLGKKYRVRLCKKVPGNNWGLVEHRNCLIRLRYGLSKDQLEESFLHELIHCAAANNLPYGVKEHTVFGISSGLYAILKDNRLLRQRASSRKPSQ